MKARLIRKNPAKKVIGKGTINLKKEIIRIKKIKDQKKSRGTRYV